MPRRRARVRSLLAVIGGQAPPTACNSSADSRAEDPATAGPPAYGDTFIQASIGDIGGLIPSLTSDQSSHEGGGMIYDGLGKLDKDLNMVPAMAESWTYSKDCLDLTFRLRRDIKWHDGYPFNADDVVFTYQAMVNPKTPAPFKEGFLLVKSVDAPDPYTVHVHYDKPYARAVETWGTYILPKHLLQSFVGAGPMREAPQNSQPVGTGPYRFQERKPGGKGALGADPHHYQRRPAPS